MRRHVTQSLSFQTHAHVCKRDYVASDVLGNMASSVTRFPSLLGCTVPGGLDDRGEVCTAVCSGTECANHPYYLTLSGRVLPCGKRGVSSSITNHTSFSRLCISA